MQASKQAENEAAFREENEQIEQRRKQLNSIAQEDNQLELRDDGGDELMYLCECSDENCRERIRLLSSLYNDIHTTRTNFIIRPGHEVAKIEDVTEKNDDYFIVKKHDVPPENNPKLHPTDTNNV